MTEPLRFYTDKHVDKKIAVQLRLRGVDMVRCEEVGLGDASDETHLEYATHAGRVMVTCDTDFLRLNAEWHEQERHHTGIAFMYNTVCNEIGIAVELLFFWHEAILGEAATLAQDFHNQVVFIRE